MLFMKRIFITIVIAAVAIASIQSCKKVIDAIFNGVNVKAPEVRIPLPAIPLICPGECPGITSTTKFNLDSTIKANTAGLFGAKDVKSIKIKEIKIDLPEADANNNLSNFQTARVTLQSDNNPNSVEIVNFTFEDVYATSKTVTVTNNIELLPYLKGSELSYTMYGRMRRITTKPLTFVTVVTLRVE